MVFKARKLDKVAREMSAGRGRDSGIVPRGDSVITGRGEEETEKAPLFRQEENPGRRVPWRLGIKVFKQVLALLSVKSERTEK